MTTISLATTMGLATTRLDIVGVADIVSLVINGDLVGALLSCPEVATVPSDKSQQLHYVL